MPWPRAGPPSPPARARRGLGGRGHAGGGRRPSRWSQLDYAVAVDAATLEEPTASTDAAALRLLIAAQVGPVRLIDNSAAAVDGADDLPARPDVTRQVRQLERIG